MQEFVSIGSRDYFILLSLLTFSRSMDFLSTWIATPNLVLEGNPVAKKLGWKWGIPVNLIFCFVFAAWPLPAVVITTTSLLVAARNFQTAWLMRTAGEHSYRHWHVMHLQRSNISIFMLCLFGQTGLTALVGVALILFSPLESIPMAIGIGMIAYAVAVAFYTLLSVWRIRRQ